MRNVSNKAWKEYTSALRRLSNKASSELETYILSHGGYDNIKVTKELIDYAYGLVTKYGEGSAELACEMYERIAALQGVKIPPAEPALTASRDETAMAINGSMLQASSGKKLPQVADRLVKQAAADTTLKNAKRDKAQWAWIPSGDSCAFCIALASRGWQNAGKITLKGNHAEHIHANCDCNYAIKFGNSLEYSNYNPDKFKKIYDSAEGKSSAEKIKSIRKTMSNGIDKTRKLSKALKFESEIGWEFIPANAEIRYVKVIAGKGTDTKIRVVNTLTEDYGGNPEDWMKCIGRIDSDKYVFDVHWYEKDGIMYMPKIKYRKEK